LGIGYNSAERTRGLVEGFEGEAIEHLHAGAAASFLILRQHDCMCQLPFLAWLD
jgi:hypothetical protein